MVKEGRHAQRQEHMQASVHIHMVSHTHIINFLVPQFSRWLWQATSLINDQWRTVRLRNEKAHQDSTPHSLRGSEGNTGSNVTSKTLQRSSAFWVSFLSATQPGNLLKGRFSEGWREFSGAASCGGMQGFYIVL